MKVKVADEVWVATALLHREQPGQSAFSVAEIVDRARRERLTEALRPGVQVHAYLHCVANKRPNPSNHRMLFATQDGRRRLFREGDAYHDHREGGKIHPHPGDLPEEYRHLVDWYLQHFYASATHRALADLGARRVRKFDQDLCVFRSTYDELTAGERQALRKDLAALVAAGDSLELLRMGVLVHVDRVLQDSAGEIVEEEHAQLTPNVMLRAMTAWDEGEIFAPGALGTY